MNTEFKIGDWVESHSAGIWQIYRYLRYIDLNPATGEEEQKVTIFSKRFINSYFKRSFSTECCDSFFIKHLSAETTEALNLLIRENPSLYDKFCKYTPRPIDAIYNARIKIPNKETVKQVERKISVDMKFSAFEINSYLYSLGYNTKDFPCWTVQFVSKDFYCENDHLIYKFNRIIES